MKDRSLSRRVLKIILNDGGRRGGSGHSIIDVPVKPFDALELLFID